MFKRINEYTSTVLLFCLVLFVAGSPVYAATYNTKTGELSLPAVYDGEKTYTDVILKLNPNGTYTFVQRTEAALPFQCANNFSESTLDLITDQMSVADINLMLGCHWSMTGATESKSSFDQSDGIDKSYTWSDEQCTGIVLLLNANGEVISKSVSYDNNCKFRPNQSYIYDMTNKRFFITNIIVDNTLVAPFTVLNFDVENETWTLISAEIVDRGQPPFLCDAFTEDTFNKLQLIDALSEAETVLGCQWAYKNDDSLIFNDHECGTVVLSISDSFSFKQVNYAKTGCGS